MGNLSKPIPKLLFNTLAASDFGISQDMLIALQGSYFRPGFKFHALGVGLEMECYMTGCITREKIEPDDGSIKCQLLTINDLCPCEDCNYEYGITIEGTVRDPGVLNDNYYPTNRFYGSVLDNVQECSDGTMSEEDVLLMEDTILKQIFDDEDAIVEAGRMYLISDDDATDESTLVINSNGNTITITVAGDHSTPAVTGISDFVTAINVQLAGEITAFPGATDTEFYLISPVGGANFTVEAGTDTSITWRKIAIRQKDVNVQFHVKYDNSFVAGIEGCYGFMLDCTDDSVADVDIYFQDGSGDSFSEADIDDLVDSINDADIGLRAVNVDGYHVWVTGVQEFDDLSIRVTFPAGSSILLVGLVQDPFGRFPYLTSDDVFRVFMHVPQNGMLSNMTYRRNEPIDGERYVKYILTSTCDHVDSLSEGASHLNLFRGSIEIYILESLVDDLLWDSNDWMDSDPAIPDSSFDDLIEAFCPVIGP